jgi:hypothetical protein
MTGLQEMVQWKIVSGEPMPVGDVTVTPQSQALTIRWPNGGLVWNRPIAVVVARGEETARIPVVDVTRMAQLGLLGLSIAFSVLTAMKSIRHKEEQ